MNGLEPGDATCLAAAGRSRTSAWAKILGAACTRRLRPMLAVLLVLPLAANGPTAFALPDQDPMAEGPPEGKEIIEEVVEGLTGETAREGEPETPQDEHPLRTIDTTSPRSTLGDFLAIMEAEYCLLYTSPSPRDS